MLASRGSDTHEDMADTLARDGAARSPHVVAAFRAVDRALCSPVWKSTRRVEDPDYFSFRFLPPDARADAYIDSPARSGAFHQSSPSIYAAALEALDLGGARCRTVWKSKFYGAFVLNHRVVLHAIDATLARWRGGAGSLPLDVHPTHWLICAQAPELP